PVGYFSVGAGSTVAADVTRVIGSVDRVREGSLGIGFGSRLQLFDVLASLRGDDDVIGMISLKAHTIDVDALILIPELCLRQFLGGECNGWLFLLLRFDRAGLRFESAGLRSRLRVGGGGRSGSLSCCDDWGCGQARDCQGHRGGEGELLHILLSKITDVCEGLRM